jgi:hypothetical protein
MWPDRPYAMSPKLRITSLHSSEQIAGVSPPPDL